MKDKLKAAVVQDSSIPFDAEKTARKACRLIEEAASNGAELVVFPEAFLGTYPKGLTFDSPVGKRHPEGRRDYLKYYDGAVEIDGAEIDDIVSTARENNIFGHGTFFEGQVLDETVLDKSPWENDGLKRNIF